MVRTALLLALLAGTTRQERQVVVHATIISCKTGDRKALPAGKLDAISKQLVEETNYTQFEILSTGTVRGEDGAFTKLALGTASSLQLTFKPTAPGTLSDLQLTEEAEHSMVTVTSTATVTEKRIVSKSLISTKCSVGEGEPILIGVAGTADGAIALVLRITSK
jgi:hypothetical protein